MKCILDGYSQALTLFFSGMGPGVRGNPVNVGDGLAQNLRSPDLARTRSLKEQVPGGVALHSDRIESRARIGNGEIEAERPAVPRPGRFPPMRLQELLDGFREAIVFVISMVPICPLFRHEAFEQGSAGFRGAVRNGTRIFEVAL